MFKLQDIISPKTEQDLKTRNALLVTLFCAAFLILYVFPFTTFANWRVDTIYAFVLVIFVALIALFLSSVDPLLHSKPKKNRYVAFYQAQLPSLYIKEKCNLTDTEAKNKWFTFFNQWANPTHPNHAYYNKAFHNGYECRGIYYIQWISMKIIWLSVASLAVFAILTWLAGFDSQQYYSFLYDKLLEIRIIFPLLLLIFNGYLRFTQKPDADNPSGVWLKWKEINDILKDSWEKDQGR